jgi:hypothetical protein
MYYLICYKFLFLYTEDNAGTLETRVNPALFMAPSSKIKTLPKNGGEYMFKSCRGHQDYPISPFTLMRILENDLSLMILPSKNTVFKIPSFS